MRPLTYITMCSGIECVSLAAAGLNWKPLCFSEVDPFACAVLKFRHPCVPNLGDMTRADWSRYRGKCDLVAAGTPCQAFSVAGGRKSLSDPRGNLTLAFVEAVNAINPKFIIWENVPGTLWTRDNAFGRFLGALAGNVRPLEPGPRPGRGRSSFHWRWDKKARVHRPKWPDGGAALGPKRSLAWRVLDARFFGVPQRRRRVFVVAGRVGERPDPSEILLELEGVRGHLAASPETRQNAAAAIARGINGGGEKTASGNRKRRSG